MVSLLGALPLEGQGCPGKVEGQSVRAFCREFWFQNPLARACPGHPRLEPATISAPKTWMAGPSPATGILLVAQDRGLATVADSPRGILLVAQDQGLALVS